MSIRGNRRVDRSESCQRKSHVHLSSVAPHRSPGLWLSIELLKWRRGLALRRQICSRNFHCLNKIRKRISGIYMRRKVLFFQIYLYENGRSKIYFIQKVRWWSRRRNWTLWSKSGWCKKSSIFNGLSKINIERRISYCNFFISVENYKESKNTDTRFTKFKIKSNWFSKFRAILFWVDPWFFHNFFVLKFSIFFWCSYLSLL